MAVPAHPYAEIFPMLGFADGEALRVDMEVNGQRERIVILDGKILDGRNRHTQLVKSGVIDDVLPPEGDELWVTRFRRYNRDQDGDPLAWVLSKNLHRRHLTESQRAMVAARLEAFRHGGARPDSTEQDANLHLDRQGAAEALQVSPRSVASAAKVRDHGAPELAARVDRGELAVSTGAEIASLSIEDQIAILDQRDPKGLREALRKHRASRAGAGRAVANTRVQPPDDLDYSPTPPWATRALLHVVFPHLGVSLTGLTVLEPACGEGHISGVLLETDALAVWSSDIFDYSVDGVSPPGWVGLRNYLAGEPAGEGVDWVITNSPFREKAEAFAHRALAEAGVGVAMFVRLGWLASNGRYERLYSVNPPTLIAIFAEDVPLHMGRWEPDGATLSDYVWLIWIKGQAPRPPFWIPPGQRKALTLPDDVERFTANPVRMPAQRNAEVHAQSEAISVSKAEAMAIITARYTGDNGQQLADELGKPLNTIRKWAWEDGVSSQARSAARGAVVLAKVNAAREQEA